MWPFLESDIDLRDLIPLRNRVNKRWGNVLGGNARNDLVDFEVDSFLVIHNFLLPSSYYLIPFPVRWYLFNSKNKILFKIRKLIIFVFFSSQENLKKFFSVMHLKKGKKCGSQNKKIILFVLKWTELFKNPIKSKRLNPLKLLLLEINVWIWKISIKHFLVLVPNIENINEDSKLL